MQRALLILAASTALSGCQTIGGFADHVGSYMPVIGDRCEHWQCFTSEGRAQSDAVLAERERQENGGEAPVAADAEKESDEDEEAPAVAPVRRDPIIPPSSESGLPSVEQRGSRKPFTGGF